MLRGHVAAGQDMIEFAVPHTLAFAFFPAWVSELREQLGPIKSRLIALNVHDAVLRLVEGSCDLLMAYHHDAQPIPLETQRYEMIVLGQESLIACVAPAPDGSALWTLPGQPAAPVPYLGYASGAYLGRMVELVLRQAKVPVHLDKVYETDMAEGLKAMAIEGHGLAFLPQSAVNKELASGQLLRAAADLSLSLQVRLYRAKPSAKGPAKGAAQALWQFLLARRGSHAQADRTETMAA